MKFNKFPNLPSGLHQYGDKGPTQSKKRLLIWAAWNCGPGAIVVTHGHMGTKSHNESCNPTWCANGYLESIPSHNVPLAYGWSRGQVKNNGRVSLLWMDFAPSVKLTWESHWGSWGMVIKVLGCIFSRSGVCNRQAARCIIRNPCFLSCSK